MTVQSIDVTLLPYCEQFSESLESILRGDLREHNYDAIIGAYETLDVRAGVALLIRVHSGFQNALLDYLVVQPSTHDVTLVCQLDESVGGLSEIHIPAGVPCVLRHVDYGTYTPSIQADTDTEVRVFFTATTSVDPRGGEFIMWQPGEMTVLLYGAPN